MFCTKCGTELRDGVAFCTRCGAPVSYSVKSSSKVDETDNMKTVFSGETTDINGNLIQYVSMPGFDTKRIPKWGGFWKVLASAIGATIAIIALLAIWYFSYPVINMGDYIVFETKGYEGEATASASFDYDRFIEENAGKPKITQAFYFIMENLGGVDRESIDLTVELMDPAEILYESVYLSGKVEPSKNLKSGDVVKYTWRSSDLSDRLFNSVASVLSFKTRVTYKTIEYIVEPLEKVEYIDPFEEVTFSFAGDNGEGTVDFVFPDNGLNYNIDRKANLSNGDQITVFVELGGNTEEEFATKYGFLPDDMSKQYTVSGLSASSVSPEENNPVTSGANMYEKGDITQESYNALIDNYSMIEHSNFTSGCVSNLDDFEYIFFYSGATPSRIVYHEEYESGDSFDYENGYEYNSDGQIILFIGDASTTEYNNVVSYIYSVGVIDEAHRGISDNWPDEAGGDHSYHVDFSINGNGTLFSRTITYDYVQPDGSQIYEIKYMYNKNGQLIKSTLYYSDDYMENEFVSEATYDDQGHLKSINDNEYECDELGRIIKEISHYHAMGSDGEQQKTVSISYNDDRITQMSIRYSDRDDVIYSCEYDSSGRLTSISGTDGRSAVLVY